MHEQIGIVYDDKLLSFDAGLENTIMSLGLNNFDKPFLYTDFIISLECFRNIATISGRFYLAKIPDYKLYMAFRTNTKPVRTLKDRTGVMDKDLYLLKFNDSREELYFNMVMEVEDFYRIDIIGHYEYEMGHKIFRAC